MVSAINFLFGLWGTDLLYNENMERIEKAHPDMK